MPTPPIRLVDVREHNLDGVTVEIPHGKLTVVTGVSGSGKSSLIFDTLHAASERRYLETLSAHARRFLQRLPTPKMAAASGLSPSIALGQQRAGDHARSTVGTLSGLHDLLRFWFARESGLEPRDFSFATAGACPECRGIGSADEVSRELLVADGTKTLREGALVPTTPTGYIVYSQVTVDALNTVCRAHGFDVDIPWQQLTREQHDVVFYGSDRVEVPFGKHSLESRMRWEGITAKPRELGHYKGIIPTIEDTLRRSRNENALRFARSVPCRACDGSRLAEQARNARIGGVSIIEASRWPLPELAQWCSKHDCDESVRLQRRLQTYARLGLDHLTCERATSSLSGGEHQRLRLGAMVTGGLAGVTFVFDEPSIGLHVSEEAAVLELLLELRDAGNTVVVVEHSEHALRAADHVIDIGPGPGTLGGEVLFAGPPEQLAQDADARSATRAHYAAGGEHTGAALRERREVGGAWIDVHGASANNLHDVDVRFAIGNLNVVAGVAGAGKSTLVSSVLAKAVKAKLAGEALPDTLRELGDIDAIGQVVRVGQDPIGRTPRSNPATYTGVFDDIRKCFAAEPVAKERGFNASTFSFNTKKGGRCVTCEGSGREVVGMHGLPAVELSCGECHGRRFQDDVLAVRYRGEFSILDVLDATVADARAMFADHKKIMAVLDAMHLVGLGHLTLGQPATTLSGGEAQRVRLAGELARGGRKKTLFVLEEPTIGLHRADVAQLLSAFDGLLDKGHTVVLVEHDLDVLRVADHLIDIGPGAGAAGGRCCGEGTPEEIAQLDTPTGRALAQLDRGESQQMERASSARPDCIRLRGATTHNLQGVDVDVPADAFTVVTGVSGSGKSSLVFDTLFGESRARFTEHLSGHVQRQLGASGARARSLRDADGLRPAIALAQRTEADGGNDLRATVATTGELHPLLRTLWSRLGGTDLPAGAFSFFQRDGACPDCAGLGSVERCDPEHVIVAPEQPLLRGALDVSNKVVADYVDPSKRYRAVVEAVASARGWDLEMSWAELPRVAQQVLLHGAGDEEFEAVWQHEGAEGGEPHRWQTKWLGIAGDIDREYARRQASGAVTRRKDFAALLSQQPCVGCGGSRLREPVRSVQVAGRTLPDVCRLSASELSAELREGWQLAGREQAVAAETLAELQRRLVRLEQLGLGHLQLDRVTATMSAGERQRLRLARQLAAPLTNCIYVLDEPSLGLHPKDTQALLEVIRGLVVAGNAVVAVEHDMSIVSAADHVLEIGPGAGDLGGHVVAAGAPADLPVDSRTARCLAAGVPELRGAPRSEPTDFLKVRGANAQHLADLDLDIPIASMTVVTGVSGSGKTTLVRRVIGETARLGRAVGCREIVGLDAFADVVQDADARRSRARTSCVATLLPTHGELKKQFAATEQARDAGFRAVHFAFLGKSGGACRACNGLGWLRSEFDFLGADSWLICEQCDGRRFDEATLAVKWRDLSIADALHATIDEMLQHAEAADLVKMAKPLRIAKELGLGYLRLGQSADSLSGGEAQRLALAVHLATPTRGKSLFLLDEPTRGLHPDDVAALLAAFERLLTAGHTIVAIEHDLAVIGAADHVIDLGPGAGADGGRVTGVGTPATVWGSTV